MASGSLVPSDPVRNVAASDTRHRHAARYGRRVRLQRNKERDAKLRRQHRAGEVPPVQSGIGPPHLRTLAEMAAPPQHGSPSSSDAPRTTAATRAPADRPGWSRRRLPVLPTTGSAIGARRHPDLRRDRPCVHVSSGRTCRVQSVPSPGVSGRAAPYGTGQAGTSATRLSERASPIVPVRDRHSRTARPPPSLQRFADRPRSRQAPSRAQDDARGGLSAQPRAGPKPSFSTVLRHHIPHLSSQSSKIPGVSIRARMKISRSENIEFPACSTSCSRARWVLGEPS